MSEKNIIAIACAGIMKQGTLFVDIYSKDKFDQIVPSIEIFYSPECNIWKSPIIKDNTIEEIRNIINKAIEKSNDEITEENSIKEDDDKSKVKKSRFIEGSENLYNFKITEFKQLLAKEFGFKQFSSVNKQEKVKTEDEKKEKPDEKVEEKIVKEEEIVEKKVKKTATKKKSEKNENTVVAKEEKPETVKDETTEKKKIIKKVLKKKEDKSEDEQKKVENKVENKKTSKVPISKKKVVKNDDTSDSDGGSGIKVKPVVKTIDSDSDDDTNVAEAINSDNSDSD